MKVLVTGIHGQLGYDVMKELKRRGYIAFGYGSDTMDITKKARVEEVLEKIKPDAVIHCAAYTAVDRAEDEKEKCYQVNVKGTEYLARVCQKLGSKFVYLSTDYVFSGDGIRPWEPEDEAHPLNVYGQTKYEGEEMVRKYLSKYFIVRISWVFGWNGNNFVKTMLRLGKEKGAVKVVADQIGSPTYTYDLAQLLVDMIETDAYGNYHATNEGTCSWYEFAKEIFKIAKMEEVEVTPVSSEEFPARAKRPSNSRMNKEKIIKNGFNNMPTWQNALQRYIPMIMD